MSAQAPQTPNGITLEIGQHWAEVDQRFTRTVEICGWNEEGYVIIRNLTHRGRYTKAKLARFNGKRGGYELRRVLPPRSQESK